MVVREAGKGDEESPIRLRLEFLEEDDGPVGRSLRETVRKQMTGFLPEHLGKDFFAFLLEEHEPANRRFPTGILVKKAIDKGRERNYSFIFLKHRRAEPRYTRHMVSPIRPLPMSR